MDQLTLNLINNSTDTYKLFTSLHYIYKCNKNLASKIKFNLYNVKFIIDDDVMNLS